MDGSARLHRMAWHQSDSDSLARREIQMGAGIDLWIVYDHPSDIPDYYVARRHTVRRGAASANVDYILCTELEPVREALYAKGLGCIPRFANDDPCIIETWL